jgi:hypothetical protein
MLAHPLGVRPWAWYHGSWALGHAQAGK